MVDRRTFGAYASALLLAPSFGDMAQLPDRTWHAGLFCFRSRQSDVDTGRFAAFVPLPQSLLLRADKVIQ